MSSPIAAGAPRAPLPPAVGDGPRRRVPANNAAAPPLSNANDIAKIEKSRGAHQDYRNKVLSNLNSNEPRRMSQTILSAIVGCLVLCMALMCMHFAAQMDALDRRLTAQLHAMDRRLDTLHSEMNALTGSDSHPSLEDNASVQQMVDIVRHATGVDLREFEPLLEKETARQRDRTGATSSSSPPSSSGKLSLADLQNAVLSVSKDVASLRESLAERATTIESRVDANKHSSEQALLLSQKALKSSEHNLLDITDLASKRLAHLEESVKTAKSDIKQHDTDLHDQGQQLASDSQRVEEARRTTEELAAAQRKAKEALARLRQCVEEEQARAGMAVWLGLRDDAFVECAKRILKERDEEAQYT